MYAGNITWLQLIIADHNMITGHHGDRELTSIDVHIYIYICYLIPDRSDFSAGVVRGIKTLPFQDAGQAGRGRYRRMV